MRRLDRDRRGVAALEAAIILPVLLMLMLCGLDIGWQMITEMALENGAEEAARFVETGNTNDATVAAAYNSSTTKDPKCQTSRTTYIPQLVRYQAPSILGSTTSLTVSPGTVTASGGAIPYTFQYVQPYLTPVARAVLGKTQTHTVKVLVYNDSSTSDCSTT